MVMMVNSTLELNLSNNLYYKTLNLLNKIFDNHSRDDIIDYGEIFEFIKNLSVIDLILPKYNINIGLFYNTYHFHDRINKISYCFTYTKSKNKFHLKYKNPFPNGLEEILDAEDFQVKNK